MSKYTLAVAAILAILIVGGSYWLLQQPMSEPQGQNVSSGKISNETDTAIKSAVVAFGAHLKNVSLLASNASAQIESEYGPYLSAELLAKWKAKPADALGRQTSSPWPDRIEVVTVSPRGDNTYAVEGNVIEVTSANAPNEAAAVYPVSLTVSEISGEWRITSASKGAYSEIPQRMSIKGVWECLPHKGDGPHTTECAFGLKEDGTGKHYAVSTSLMSQYPVDYPTGAHVQVDGVMVPKNQLNSNAYDTYNIIGIIGATTIKEI